MKVLCLDVGVLLNNDNEDFTAYNTVYDEKYGYYDENQIAYKKDELELAIKFARDYVKKGVNMTYAVITDQGECSNGYDGNFDDCDIRGFDYCLENVVFSIAKIDDKIVENFVCKED